MNFEALEKFACELEGDSSLEQPSLLRQRLEVVDRIEACLTPMLMASLNLNTNSEEALLYRRLLIIQANLEAINHKIYAAIRCDIQEGDGRTSLARWVAHLSDVSALDVDGYDCLDDVISAVLKFPELANAAVQPTAEMVSYQPTPARHVFDLLERLALTSADLLVDIGSGLGHVSLLAAAWTSASSLGIEIEPAYVVCARQVAQSLNLKRVTFIEQDARQADFACGTVFYLYTPFTGTMLRQTLDALRCVAISRTIRIATFGPCTAAVAAEDWLQPLGKIKPPRVAVFRSSL